MKVFISWSGQQSRIVAELLRDWLPSVLQNVEPWLSSEDITPGQRWLSEISARLEEAEVGIICLTAQNMKSQWLHFEAGAISKRQRGARVCVYAVDIEPAQIGGPLSQFQSTAATQEGTYRLLQSLNEALGTAGLQEDRLKRVFAMWWPDLDSRLRTLAATQTTALHTERTIDSKVDEILSILKGVSESNASGVPPPPVRTSARPMGRRPRLFIGSSTEGLRVAEAIQVGLDDVAECTVWNQGVFGLTETTIESIVDTAAEYDFAVLVLTPDDTTLARGASSSSPRDNLVFELGLFTGILGRARTFMVYPRSPSMRLPSDLAGVTAATYTMRSDGNLQAALGPVCTRIKRAMGVE